MLIRSHALLCVAFLDEEHGREKGKTSDSKGIQTGKKGNSKLLHKKKPKCTCSLGAEKIRLTKNTASFVFLLSLLHSLPASKYVEPQHFRSQIGILPAKFSGVALSNLGGNDNFHSSQL